MNQIWPIGTEIWIRTDKKCGQTDGRTDRIDGRTTPKIYPSDFVGGIIREPFHFEVCFILHIKDMNYK